MLTGLVLYCAVAALTAIVIRKPLATATGNALARDREARYLIVTVHAVCHIGLSVLWPLCWVAVGYLVIRLARDNPRVP